MANTKEEAERKAGCEYARRKSTELFKNSLTKDRSDTFPTFTMDELQLGKVLGKGGFGTVREIRSFKVAGSQAKSARGGQDAVADDGFESRKFIADNCLRNNGDARYAVKFLSPEVVANTALYILGLTDMAVETRFLSCFEHPNIIKMRAISGGNRFGEQYFIVMDRLYETLDKRILKWEKQSRKTTGFFGKLADKSGDKANALLEDRLVAAFDLCAAVNYLNGRKILYRDIKPENIGFDIRDDVKLFDFGLAKELSRDVKSAGKGLYNLTGKTGSLRYMAPEVANEQPYNEKCDVYSMSVLIWQMMSGKEPYEMYTPKAMREKVFNGAFKRPLIQEGWPQFMKLLLKRGWEQDIDTRHTMKNMENILKQEITALRDGNSTGLEHYRRRSTFVYRKK